MTGLAVLLPLKLGQSFNRPLNSNPGANDMSLKNWSVPVLNLPISSISKTRPYFSIRRRNVRLKKAMARSGIRTPSRRAIFRSASITAAVGLWAVVDVAKYPLLIEDYFFGTYIERAWGGFRGQCDALDPSWFPMAYYCVAVSLVSYAVFAAVAGYVLSRRNLTA